MHRRTATRKTKDHDESSHRRGPSRSSNHTNVTASTTLSRLSQTRGFRRITRALSLSSSRRPTGIHLWENASRAHSSGNESGTTIRSTTEKTDGTRPLTGKTQYVEIRVKRDDVPSVPALPPLIPARTTSARTEWPATEREYVEKAAGTFHFATVPTLVRTPWEYERARRPATAVAARARPFPRHIFEQLLPHEIYDWTLEGLCSLYTTHSTVDVRALQQDLISLMLVDRKWHRAAREQMYRELWLPSNLEISKRTFAFNRPKSRLRLLLGVLMTYPGLAGLVQHIHITDRLAAELPVEPYDEPANELRNQDGLLALETVVAIVLRCPKLEGFTGYVPPTFVPDVAGLIKALSTRKLLRSHAWCLTSIKLNADGIIDTGLGDFIECHGNWTNLQTLVLSNSMKNFELGGFTIPMILDRLPHLKHLLVRGFSAGDFSDETLWALPPTLESLRLESLSGISDEGFEQFAFEELALSLRRLSLIKMKITSMWTIQTMLRNLERLERFCLVQDAAPKYIRSSPRRERPHLESSSLEDLHWNIFFPDDSTTHLVNAISNGYFPRLRRIKVPSDYDGAVQSLCRPIERRNLEVSDMELLTRFEQGENVHYECFLRLAQIYAQLRVRDREKQPSFNFIIEDDEEGTRQTHVIGKFVGSMDSRIEYDLSPDLLGSPYGTVRVEDLQDPPLLMDVRDGVERKMDLRLLF